MSTTTPWPSSVFKAYDIRGIVPQQLNEDFAYKLGLTLAKKARQSNVKTIVVGYDGRASSPSLSKSLQEGILAGGINTADLGMVPTPVVYYATNILKTGSGVAITGSHNPSNYNGFKIMMAGKTLHGPEIQALGANMQRLHESPPSATSTNSRTTKHQLLDHYVSNICGHIKLARPMKIAIDCGNGVGGVVAERLFKNLGCDVDTLFCDVDGSFPNHHPDPAVPENLADLIKHIKETDCELGLAFDGDADRLGVVTKEGEIIWPDRQLILFARDVLSRNTGQPIVFDVKCSRHVAKAIEESGGEPIMWQTGHSLIKAKMAQINSPLGGEMSGHIFFSERWYGFDDGLYAGARLLEILSRHKNPSEVLHNLPADVSTPEIKLEMSEGEPHKLIKQLQEKGQFPLAKSINTIDGVRAEYDFGFGLARASNTTPVVVLRFEANSQDDLDLIKNEFRKALIELEPKTNIPF